MEMTPLEELMAEHQRIPFPDCIEKGEDYGEVNSVLIGADIYGWALKASRGELHPDELPTLVAARDRLERSIEDFPEGAKSYFQLILKLAVATIEHEGLVPDSEFLVCYDYGMGGLWGFMYAESIDAIKAKYPELLVVTSKPDWMTDEYFERKHSEPLWLDSPPTGILLALLDDRSKRRK
jgi:hypothetical protein